MQVQSFQQLASGCHPQPARVSNRFTTNNRVLTHVGSSPLASEPIDYQATKLFRSIVCGSRCKIQGANSQWELTVQTHSANSQWEITVPSRGITIATLSKGGFETVLSPIRVSKQSFSSSNSVRADRQQQDIECQNRIKKPATAAMLLWPTNSKRALGRPVM